MSILRGGKTTCQRIGWRLVIFSLCLSLLVPGAGGGRALAAGDLIQPAAQGEEYLIIAADELADGLSGFILLKQAQGFTVTLRTLSQTGATPDQIKAAIANNPPDYLLLVGAVDRLPAWDSRVTSGVKTDLYYATLGGINDIVPDLAYGRLPAHSPAELAAVLDKWQAYAGLSGGEDWLSRAALIATDDPDDYTAVEAAHNQVIADYLLPAGFYGRFPSNPQPGGDKLYPRTYEAARADVIAALNDGRGLVVYHGHGGELGWDGPIFRQGDVRALTGPPVPLVLSLASRTGLAADESFAETWLLQPESGALAFIGAGSDGYWDADIRLEASFFAALFDTPAAEKTTGRVLNDALNRFSSLYLPGDRTAREYREMYQVLGDPAMVVFPDAPLRFSLAVEPARLAVCAEAASQASALVTLDSRHAEPVTLSLEGVPAGVSAAFDPPQVNPPGTSSLTLNISAGTAGGSYPLIVKGQRGNYWRSAGLALYSGEQPPGSSPLALQPEMGAWNVSLRPALRWQAVPGAASYQVQVSPLEDFSSTVIQLNGIAGTSILLTENLQPGQRYYWRVRAINGCGSGAYSRASWFTTLPPPGECPPGSSAETIYNADLNSLPQEWEAGGGWQPGSAFGRSGVLFAAVPADIDTQSLLSARFSLPAEENSLVGLFLAAQTAYDFSSDSACLGGGLIEYSNQQPDDWQPLPETALLTPPYEGTLASSFGNPLGGRRAWCRQSGWTRLAVNLMERRGEAARLRFVLGSDGRLTAPGWALDDLSITACRANLPDYAPRLSPSEQSLVVSPGGSAVFSLHVRNDGRLPDQVQLQLESGLSGSLSADSLQLADGESAAVEAQLNLPANAAPGSSHPAQVVAESSGDPSVGAGAALTIIARQCGVGLAAPAEPVLAAAGSHASLLLSVTNSGNEWDTFSLSASSAAGWRVELPASLHIAPGGKQEITVQVAVPAGTPPGARASLNLAAQSHSCPDAQANLVRSAGTPGSSHYLPFVGR
ncbi:MAG: C25 family cysteine peptidase [Bellilinea sp.]